LKSSDVEVSMLPVVSVFDQSGGPAKK